MKKKSSKIKEVSKVDKIVESVLQEENIDKVDLKKELPDILEITVDYLENKTGGNFDLVIQSGRGFFQIQSLITEEKELFYSEIPHLPKSSYNDLFSMKWGMISGKKVAILCGRYHPYEGFGGFYSHILIRALSRLGAKKFISINSAGTLTPDLSIGTMTAIENHINFGQPSPLACCSGYYELGPKYLDLSNSYSRQMIQVFEEVAIEEKLSYSKGIYAGVLGPEFPTVAEYDFYGKMGASIVGMGIIGEIVTACHCGLDSLALGIITNGVFPQYIQKTGIEQIIYTQNLICPALCILLNGIIEKI